MTLFVDVQEAQARLSWLLEQVARGKHVVISKAGQPIADLVPHQRARVILGGPKGQFVYNDEAFDSPDPDIQRMYYGEDEFLHD